MVDGEVKKLTSPLKIKTHPKALCVLAPEVKTENKNVAEEKAEA
jgi:diacylglycerol kinase family enzyme